MLIKNATEVPNLDYFIRTMWHAAKSGTWEGRGMDGYFRRCRHTIYDLGLIAILTRDVGYHTSGWWKNPDYERCFHLSLSFRDPATGEYAPRNKLVTGLLLEGVYGRNKRLIWCEPPYSADGKATDTWHYRLFCDEHWKAILPRGEVYSRELTEAGWKSYSDVQADLVETRG